MLAEQQHQCNRDDRRKQRAGRVERLTQTEGAAADRGRRFVGDHRVAGRAANALAHPVGEARRHDRSAAVASGKSGLDKAASP